MKSEVISHLCDNDAQYRDTVKGLKNLFRIASKWRWDIIGKPSSELNKVRLENGHRKHPVKMWALYNSQF